MFGEIREEGGSLEHHLSQRRKEFQKEIGLNSINYIREEGNSGLGRYWF